MKFWSRTIIVIFAVGTIVSFVFYFNDLQAKNETNLEVEKQQKPEPTTYEKIIKINDGDTYGVLMKNAGISGATSTAIFEATKDIYDLTKIRSGNQIDLVYDIETNQFEKMVYQIDSETKLQVYSKNENGKEIWSAEIIDIIYEIKTKTVEGTIETSMYEKALEQGIDERAVIAFADVFQWSIDFAWEVRKDDHFKFIYEERYLDGEYIMPGKILAGKFTNAGEELYAFNYSPTDSEERYFDQNGNSVQKVFLKAPLAFKYISSGFTTGSRYISAFNISTGHRAVDYAATYGTPIRSVGDGTVIFAGWNGSYGYMVKVRHNSTYQTNYAHMSKMAARVGQKVSQGETIGYVGSTGLSTGPHLHFEMEKNGTKINPLTEELPATKGIEEENKNKYFEFISDWKNQLDN